MWLVYLLLLGLTTVIAGWHRPGAMWLVYFLVLGLITLHAAWRRPTKWPWLLFWVAVFVLFGIWFFFPALTR